MPWRCPWETINICEPGNQWGKGGSGPRFKFKGGVGVGVQTFQGVDRSEAGREDEIQGRSLAHTAV